MGSRQWYRTGDRRRPLKEAKASAGAPYRSEWRRDYARVVHSACFRRLQGKTQLFYGSDSVFRNRLTHSLEVAQIAKTIALKLNHERSTEIEPDIAEVAALVHDLGHPPFGHNGEQALDDCMKECGGFEGNAQTLRIVARLEKRKRGAESNEYGFSESGVDLRVGMNLTHRVLAGALKYDKEIPKSRSEKDGVVKGYFYTEADVVQAVKKAVLGRRWRKYTREFKTVECSIMDVADDIAYSTYDLEDAWKSGFLNPLDLVVVDKSKLQKVTSRVQRQPRLEGVTASDVQNTLYGIVADQFLPYGQLFADDVESGKIRPESPAAWFLAGTIIGDRAKQLANSGYVRTAYTSGLVDRFIGGVEIEIDKEFPQMSTVRLDDETLLAVECLKQYTYVSVIDSPRLKIPEYRGYDIVKSLFAAISNQEKRGFNLLAEDFRDAYLSLPDSSQDARRRMICDFIAGMTDTYAVDFYNRLNSDYPSTIFGPGL